ncbi:MAG: TonB-dependent receptor [Bryobacterales bacterium]|nr:TonB-dependent receptor [Bryobacterales bacterium]
MKHTHTVVPRMWRLVADWQRYTFHFAVLSLLLILLSSGSVATAQERFSEINGTAMDSSGGVLPGAKVTVTNKVTGRVTETTTTGSGAYQARNLEPGKYVVRFELKGFSVYEVPEVNLLLGKTLTVDAKMTVGTTEQTIQVTDAAPLIDTTNTTMANNITSEEFDRLPKARSFQSLALNSTSVNSGEIEGGIQVNGASGAENNFTIDGISTTSLLNGQSRQDAVFEILQEVQVKTGGISAEYGGALGGVVSGITKSGGNSFHGDIHYYLAGNKISAANRKRLLLSPSNDTTTAYYQDAKQKNDNNEIGYALGGYFIKNRLYFYSAASPNFGSRTNDYGFANGKETGSIDQDSTRHMLFNKLSFDITKSLRGSMHWLWTPTKSVGTLPGYGGECPNCITSSKAANSIRANQGFFAPQSNYGAQLDWTLTSTSLFSVRAGRFWDNYKDVGLPDITPVTYSITSVGTPGVPANYIGPSGTTNTPRVSRAQWDIVTRTYVQADFNQFFRAGGTHDLKIGIGTQKNVNNVLQDYPTGGYINIFWNRAFTSSVPGVPPAQRGTYGYYEYHEFGTGGSTGANINNIYFQDNWRIIPRLTLNLGLRLESERVPSFQRDVKEYAFDFGWGKKIAPRIGASFDVFGTGKLKVYGSWGRYYDWVKYELARGTFGGDYWRVRYRSLDTFDVYSLNSKNLPGRDLWNPAVTNSFRNRRVPGFDTIDPDIKPMASQLFNAGFEYEIAPQTVLRAGYVRNTLIRTIEDLGVLVDGNEEYFYANPGSGIASTTPPSGATKPFPTPKAVRNYNAMEMQLTKRFGSWFGSASYVYSQLRGNYSGLAASEEIRTGADAGGVFGLDQQSPGVIARPGGNANRAWDIDELLWDARGGLDPQGPLPTDRPHVFKLYGSKSFKWGDRQGTDIGAFWYGGSGTPLSTLVNTINGTQVFVNGRGDLGRTAFLTQTDLVLGHEISVAEGKRLRFEFNAQNLFNQKTSRSKWTQLNRARTSAEINLAPIDLAKGYDYRAMINATSEGSKALSPLFGMDDWFNPGFSGRLLVKFIF